MRQENLNKNRAAQLLDRPEEFSGNVALSWLFSAILVLLCAAFPVFFMHHPEAVYESRAVIYVDAAKATAAGQGTISKEDIQTALTKVASTVTAQKLLDSVVEDLDLSRKLDRITPLSASRNANLAADTAAVDHPDARSNPSPAREASDADRLRNLISIELNIQTSVMAIVVRSLDAHASADIGNSVLEHVTAMNAVEQQASRRPIEALEAKVKQTEAALMDFQMANPDTQPDNGLQSEVIDIRNRLETARHNADLLKRAKVASALSGQFPPELSTPHLDALLQDYSLANIDLSQMSLKLGPRHPDLLAATKRAEDIKTSIATEVAQIVKLTNKSLNDLIAAEKLVTKQMADQSTSATPVENPLPALQKAVEDARRNYAEALLDPSTQTQNVQSIRTVSKAVPALEPLPDSLSDVMVPSGFGALIGVVILGFIRTLLYRKPQPDLDVAAPFEDTQTTNPKTRVKDQDNLDNLVLAELSLASIPPKRSPVLDRPQLHQAPTVNAAHPVSEAPDDQASLDDMVRRLCALSEQLQALDGAPQADTRGRSVPSAYRNAHEALTVGNENAGPAARQKEAILEEGDDLSLDEVRQAMRSIKQRVEIYGRKRA